MEPRSPEYVALPSEAKARLRALVTPRQSARAVVIPMAKAA